MKRGMWLPLSNSSSYQAKAHTINLIGGKLTSMVSSRAGPKCEVTSLEHQ